jgi:hypothetical protein
MMVAQLPPDSLQHFPFELLTAKTPAAADALETFLVGLLPSAEFHPVLEFGAAGGGVFANSVLAEQAIHAHPGGPMRARRSIPRQTAPRVGHQAIFALEQSGTDRIEMDVITNGFQVAGAASIHQQGFVAPAKDVAKEFVPMIETNGISALKPAHPIHQIGFRRFQHPMKVIAHEAIGMHLLRGFLRRLGQRLPKALPIHLVQEDILAAITTAHDTVNGSRIQDSDRSRHAIILQLSVRKSKGKIKPIYGSIPFWVDPFFVAARKNLVRFCHGWWLTEDERGK